MKIQKKLILPLVVLGSSLSVPSYSLNIKNKLYSRLQSRPIKLSSDLVSLGIGDVVKAETETGITVFPNNNLKTYSRSEPVSFRLRVGDSILNENFLVSANRNNSFVGEFIRQFPTQIDALNVIKSPPYILDAENVITGEKIPFSATAALNLKQSDYFRYQIKTSFTFAGGLGKSFGMTRLQAGRSYTASGDFQIEIYKKAGDKVLVRASSLKQKERSNFVSLSPSYVFDLFESKLLNRLGQNTIPKDLIKVDFQTEGSGSLLSIEYEFDLSSVQARAAYNQMISPNYWSIQDIKAVTRGNLNEQIQVLHSRIDDAEAAALEPGSGVRRVLRSTVNFQSQSKSSSVDLFFIKGTEQEVFIEQDVSLSTNPFTDAKDNFKVATHSISSDQSGALSQVLGEAYGVLGEANTVFELDENMKIQKFVELSFLYERTDEAFSEKDAQNTAGNIYKIIPPDLQGPGIRDFIQSFANYTTANDGSGDEITLKLSVSIKPEAFALVNTLSADQIKKVTRDFIDYVRKDQAILLRKNRDFASLDLNNESFKSSGRVVDFLPAVFLNTTGSDYELQWEQLLELQKIPLFKVLGSGIITRILMKAVVQNYGLSNYEKFYDFARITMRMKGRKLGAPNEFDEGMDGRVEYVQEVLELRNRILNRNFDPSFFE